MRPEESILPCLSWSMRPQAGLENKPENSGPRLAVQQIHFLLLQWDIYRVRDPTGNNSTCFQRVPALFHRQLTNVCICCDFGLFKQYRSMRFKKSPWCTSIWKASFEQKTSYQVQQLSSFSTGWVSADQTRPGQISEVSVKCFSRWPTDLFLKKHPDVGGFEASSWVILAPSVLFGLLVL